VKGYDAHKHVKGRKRHLIVDVCGHVLTVVVHAANIQDYHGARQVLSRLAQKSWERLEKILADAIYKGDKSLHDWVRDELGWELETVERQPGQKGFQVLPKRWVVERTFAWLGRNRRLSKDYEFRSDTSEAWIFIAMSALLSRRLAITS
jgi:putative transposase